MDSGPQILQKLLPSYLELLHVEDVKPHLLAGGAITIHEYEEIQISTSFPTQRALAERLLVLLMRKGPDCAIHLLQALEKTVQCVSPQLSHYQLITELKGALVTTGRPFLPSCGIPFLPSCGRPFLPSCGMQAKSVEQSTGVPNGFFGVDTNDGEYTLVTEK